MAPVFFVMAILGCGDAGGQCTQARIEPVRYATMQQCQLAEAAALARNTDLSFPTISATCVASGPRIAEQPRRDRQG